jgi:predicted nucleic acid-binding protein
MTILVDTNILLRASDANHPLCSVCKSALEEIITRGDIPVGCAQVMIEFWVVATRPLDVNGLGFTSVKAEESLAQAEQMLTFLSEPPDIAEKWRALARDYAVIGKQAHDTRLVAFMLCHSINHLLTLNGKDFARYDFVTCVSPESIPPSPTT